MTHSEPSSPTAAGAPAYAVAAVNLFQGLDEHQLARLADISVTRTYKRGEAIFAEGEEARGLYAVLDGKVRIYKTSLAGKEHILHVFGPGEAFAEAALFQGSLLPAHAQALAKTAILFIPKDSLKRLIGQEPDLALAMMGLLAGRLRQFVHKVEELSLKEVPARLAQHLLLLAAAHSGDAFSLDLPKGQLAALLGTIPETLSRVIKKLGEEGLVDIEGRQVVIRDRNKLEELASGLTVLR